MLTMRPLPCAHVGSDGARHPDQAHEVGVEDRLRLGDRAFLRGRRGNADAGVVHQQVEPAFPSQDLPGHGVDGVVAGHVQGQQGERLWIRLRTASAGAVHGVAGGGEPYGRGLADARRGAGDEGDGAFGVHVEVCLGGKEVGLNMRIIFFLSR
jgi:hypothetical protein